MLTSDILCDICGNEYDYDSLCRNAVCLESFNLELKADLAEHDFEVALKAAKE